MKKTMLVLILVLAAGRLANAQILIAMVFGDKLNTPTLEFGLNVGVNYASLIHPEDIKFRTDITVGTYFLWKFHDRFNLQPELFFRYGAGGKKLPPYNTGEPQLDLLLENSSIERKMVYFSLPVNLKYRVWKQLRISAGPQLSLLNNSKDVFRKPAEEEGDLYYVVNSKNLLNKWDFGVTAGLSYKLKKGKGVNLEARYYAGLTNITKDSSMAQSQNSVFSFLVGIPIGAESDAKTNSSPE